MSYQADGSADGVDVELSRRLSEELSFLALGVERDGDGLQDGLATLVSTLSGAVSGFVGLRLTIRQSGHPVQLTALQPSRAGDQVVTSLRLPLPLVSRTFEEGGRLIVWSAVRGSMVDLAADLRYVLCATSEGSRPDRAVQLDIDLPLPEVVSGVDGLAQLATVHRAAGLLIGRGHDPDSVHDALRDGASAAGLSTHAWALRLLRPTPVGGRPTTLSPPGDDPGEETAP